jgi:hypothetical protein
MIDRSGRTDSTSLPDGWEERLYGEANLERSFVELREVKHFWAEAWRGRIRSEQLRFEAAWRHFDKAFSKAEESEESIPTLVRHFFLNIWCLWNALTEDAPAEDQVQSVPDGWTAELPEDLLEEFPEVGRVLSGRKAAEALVKLHLGFHTKAGELYRELLADRASAGEEEVPLWHMGLAACEHSLGRTDRARRALEDAGLAVSACEKTLTRGRSAAVLAGMLDHLGENEDAAGWRALIERLECPVETKRVLLRRAAHVAKRCNEASRLLVL